MSQELSKEEWRLEQDERRRLREAFEKKLIEAFPLFWRKIDYGRRGSYYPSASVDAGWFNLLWDCCAAVEKELNAIKHLYPVEYLPYPSQIKEKFGTLRFYYDTPEELPENVQKAIEAAVLKAEHHSAATCEPCGKAGKVRSQTPSGERIGWIKTLCDDCWKKRY